LDLVRMRMLQFTSESEGKEVVETEIPDEERDRAEFWRSAMMEELYHLSDEIADLALQEQPIPEQLIRKVLREATVHRLAQPLLCGSALHGIGVQPVLDAVGYYLPSPLDRPPVQGVDPKDQEKKLQRKPDADEPFCGLVFKILPAKTGDTYWVRVYSGTLKANSRALNPARDKRENVAQLWQIHATRRERDGQVPEVAAGDIVGVVGPRESITGDTLCDIKAPILLPTIQFAETVISMAIEPESTAERKKLAETLEMLKRQDPTFNAVENEETGQTLISGMGELHLEVIKHRLLRDFNLDVRVHKPRVSYRETVERAAEVVGECHRQHAGQQLFAQLTIKMEPYEGEKPVLVINRCSPDKVPIEFLTAALEELRSRGEGGGVIGGFPLTKLKITILDGETQLEGSNEMAFTIAAGDAFMKGLQQAGPVLLEPIMRLEISTPDEYFGAIDGDLQQRRGYIVHNENRGDRMVMEARAPLSELFGYSSAIRSLSQGRASATMEPLEYAPAPAETAASFGF
jgi:elongation factor G